VALPSSGTLSIGDIRTELGSSSGSLRTLSGLAGFSTPDAISEFYGYTGLTAITLSDVGFEDTEAGCSEGPNSETASYYSSTDPVAVNSYIYDNNRDKLNGNNQWFYYPSGMKLIQIGEDGTVNDTYSCE
jgi:hypothetical protein